MTKTAKPTDLDRKTEKLRAQRLAQEKARRDAGTWGDMSVGEIVHDASRSVFVHVWKGRRRPNPFQGSAARAVGVAANDWMSMLAWINGLKSTGFSERIVAWDISASEAQKIADERMAKHRAEGLTVVNPPIVAKTPGRKGQETK